MKVRPDINANPGANTNADTDPNPSANLGVSLSPA
jgi:hypothetical protein